MPFLTKGKTNWKYILIVLILVIVIGSGILVWQYFQIKHELLIKTTKFRELTKETEDLKKQIENLKEEKLKVETELKKEIDNFKKQIEDLRKKLIKIETTDNLVIYRNEEYGFEIKYPISIYSTTTLPTDYIVRNGWSSLKGTDSKGEVIVSFVTCQFSDIPPSEPYHSFTSELRIGASSDPKEVENCFNISGQTSVTVTINGKEFKKFKISDAASGHRAEMEIYRTIHNNTCFSVEKLKYGYLYDELEDPNSPHYNYQYSQKFKSCYETINQIISTFRFLE
jgi:predicted Holliday junction resolvase-like endonuclease